MSDEVVVVVAGGTAPPVAEAVSSVPDGAVVIAADSGIDHARALGLDVSVLVGDLDSASPEAVAVAESAGVRIERHPTAKDATDLELALDAALALNPRRVVVLAGDGGRLDHLLSSLLLLGSERYAAVEIEAWIGSARVDVVRGERELAGAPGDVRGERELAGSPGDLVTLLALNGPAHGVTTEGLSYPLAGETLEPGSSRGVSNVLASGTAKVSVEQGVVLAIRPGPEER